VIQVPIEELAFVLPVHLSFSGIDLREGREGGRERARGGRERGRFICPLLYR
jgi:hypothetical protein